MPLPLDPPAHARAVALARTALARPGAPSHELPPRLLVVDVERQSLSLIESATEIVRYPVSTAAAGVGGEEGSYRTPPGWHRIHARIGAGAPSGAVFASRIATGEVWIGEPRADDLILTRILTLDGLEEGVNLVRDVTRSRATSTSMAPTTRMRWAVPCRTAACAWATPT
jgi:UDP-N-acetylmuramate--alanine ligase